MKINAFSSILPKDLNKATANSGQFNDKQKAAISQSDNAVIVTSPEEKLISGPDNTLISLSRDRPGEIGTGAEYVSAGAIYLCAGASHGFPDKTPKGSSGELLKVNRNFNLDASTIYMSAECKSESSAGIAIKSTNLRLIARSGIKLVTRTDPANENLAPLNTSITGIELIAGNDSAGLQPMVKGDNLVDGLVDLADRVFKIAETLEHFIKQQADFNTALAKHSHPDPLNILFGLVAGGSPTAVTGGKTLEDIETKIQGELTTAFMVGSMLPDMQKHKLNLTNFTEQYLRESGGNYINSRYNKVN